MRQFRRVRRGVAAHALARRHTFTSRASSRNPSAECARLGRGRTSHSPGRIRVRLRGSSQSAATWRRRVHHMPSARPRRSARPAGLQNAAPNPLVPPHGHEPGSPGLAAPRCLQHAVIGEERHDAVEIVGVKRLKQILESLCLGHDADTARQDEAARPIPPRRASLGAKHWRTTPAHSRIGRARSGGVCHRRPGRWFTAPAGSSPDDALQTRPVMPLKVGGRPRVTSIGGITLSD